MQVSERERCAPSTGTARCGPADAYRTRSWLASGRTVHVVGRSPRRPEAPRPPFFFEKNLYMQSCCTPLTLTGAAPWHEYRGAYPRPLRAFYPPVSRHAQTCGHLWTLPGLIVIQGWHQKIILSAEKIACSALSGSPPSGDPGHDPSTTFRSPEQANPCHRKCLQSVCRQPVDTCGHSRG